MTVRRTTVGLGVRVSALPAGTGPLLPCTTAVDSARSYWHATGPNVPLLKRVSEV